MALDDLPDDDVLRLPLDRLALEVLAYLKTSNTWNTHDLVVATSVARRSEPAKHAVIEAVGWLEAGGLIAHPKPGQESTPTSLFVTRAGERALAQGLGPVKANMRVGLDLHPRLDRARTQFLIGDYELAAFAALREVEIRVREMADKPVSEVGVPLMRAAFGGKGPLADPALDGGERVGTMELFAGAIGTFKNPPSHRQVDYNDPTEASEIVLLADLLLRVLDRTAARLAEHAGGEWGCERLRR